MGTVDLTQGSGFGWDGRQKNFVEKIHVDLSGYAMTANDIYQVWDIPAQTVIHGCRCDITTAAVGTSGTIDIGITSVNADDLGDGVDMKTEASTYTRIAEAATGDFDCAAADTLDVLIKTATDLTAGPIFDLYISCTSFA